MIPLETLITFFSASILFGFSPGPDKIFVLTQSALHGRIAGLFVVLGLCTGLIVHTTAVALGVAVIFQTSAAAFSALKFIGTGYLVVLAWKAFRAPVRRVEGGAGTENRIPKLYGNAIIMNITNPSVSIFFLAFLPQFADPAAGPVSLQIMILGALFILATILVFSGIALLAGTIGPWLNRSIRSQKILNCAAGSVFLGLALKLVTTRR